MHCIHGHTCTVGWGNTICYDMHIIRMKMYGFSLFSAIKYHRVLIQIVLTKDIIVYSPKWYTFKDMFPLKGFDFAYICPH